MNRHKDKNPLDTIQLAKGILHSLDMLVYEQWFEPVSGGYSSF